MTDTSGADSVSLWPVHPSVLFGEDYNLGAEQVEDDLDDPICVRYIAPKGTE